MEIDLALLADAATVDVSGKLNILGIFDRIAVGELASFMTMSQHVVPRKARDLGYEFAFAELGPALEDLLRYASRAGH